MDSGSSFRRFIADACRLALFVSLLVFARQGIGAEPAITAISRDLVPTYDWGYKSGVKQQHGSYENGRSLHAVLRRQGSSGEQGYPDYLVWFDEHAGQAAAIERAVAYGELGKNPATHAVFGSEAPQGDQGRIWWAMGGRADSQPFDLVRSLQPFDPFGFQVVLDNFVTEPQSTTPALAVVSDTGLLAYRWRSSGSKSGEVRIRNYALPAASPPILRFEKSLGRGSSVAGLGDITIEQLWSRWDPRFRKLALTWEWFAHYTGTTGETAFGSNPFIYTNDYGVTWRSADGTPVTLPLTYATATNTPGITPHDHFSLSENSGWLPRDLGFTPGGVPWITMATGAIAGHDDGWQSTLFRWSGSTWQAVPLSHDMEGNADAMACGSVRDYLVCAYSELGTPGILLVKVSRDDGRTWTTPVAVDNVGLADSGALQRINWVSFAQPADRYLDNTARLFVGYYRVGESEGLFYKNRLRWVRVQVGPRADFNGDEIVDQGDLTEFEAAHAAGDWRADFNDDGVVDELDRTAFAAAMASESPGPSTSVPNVVGMTQAAAAAAIANAGLIVGTVTQQLSTTVPAGSVISQDPIAETTVAAGSAVTLVVSSGAPVSVPDVVGLTQTAAAATITNAGLILGVVTQQSSATVPAGSVISQSPAAGTSVADGSAVNLVVSSGSASASASVTPTSLAFGNWARNGATPGMSVTIANTGTTVLPISSISLTGNNPGQFSRSTNCPSQLPIGGTCTATVIFKPTSTGTKSAILTVALGGGVTSKTVALSGAGVNYSFSMSPTNLAFGNVAKGTTSAAKTVTITNTSTVALPIMSVTLAGTAPGQYTRTNNCPAQVSAGGKCTVSVRFKPTSTGSKSATLKVAPGGGASAKTVSLSGTGK